MLGSMVDGAKNGILKYVILFFIVLAGGGLVLTDVGGFFTGSAPADSVASVGGEKITTNEFDRKLRGVLYQQNISPRDAYDAGLADQFLQNEIASKLLVMGARDNGLEMAPEDLVDDVRQFIAPFLDGERTAKEVFDMLLRNQGMSEKAFTRILGEDKVKNMLAQAILRATIVPGHLSADYALISSHRRNISTLVIDANKVALNEDIDDELARDYYEQTKAQYQIPEKRNFDVMIFSSDELAKKITITDEQIEAYYNDNPDMFSSPDQRKIEQALVKDLTDAQNIYAMTEEGTSLQEAAQAVTNKKSSYRAPDSFDKKGLVEALAGPIFSADLGTTLEPIKTPLGWHVVHVLSEEKGKLSPLAKVKKDIEDFLKKDHLEAEFYDQSIEIEETLDSGMNVTEVAKQYELPTKSFKNIQSNEDNLDSMGENPQEVLEQAFYLDEGETSPLFEHDSKYMALTVTGVTPADYIPFDEVKDSVIKNLKQQRGLDIARNMALDLKARLDNGDITFNEAAKENGAISLHNENALPRLGQTPRYLNTANVESIFATEPGQTTFMAGNGAYLITKVNDLIVATDATLSSDLVQRQGEALNNLFQNLNVQTYTNALQDRHPVKVNGYALEQMYGQQDAY